MHNDIKQIYHVSRCGSTLMAYLLSTVHSTYSEPESGIEMANTGKILENYKNSIIKFQSLCLMNPILLKNKKVFLYRPLLQHLFKISSVEKEWIHHRVLTLKDIIKRDGLKYNFIPSNNIELIVYQWICSVIEMTNHDDVLWIQTNDFLKDKQSVMNKVCDHFEIDKITDFSLSKIDVKKLNRLRKKLLHDVNFDSEIQLVNENHGIIEITDSMKNSQIGEIVVKIENKFPSLSSFLY